MGVYISDIYPSGAHTLWTRCWDLRGPQQRPPPLPGTETQDVGWGQELGAGRECPPLQFLMIFLSKGLQGERGLRGPTGEKGELVRGDRRGLR